MENEEQNKQVEANVSDVSENTVSNDAQVNEIANELSEDDTSSNEVVEIEENTPLVESEEILEENVSEEMAEIEEEIPDFEEADKKTLISALKEIKDEPKIQRLDKYLRALKPRFDVIYDEEKSKLLEKFVSEGNEADAFEYHGNEIDKEFFALYGQLKTKRNNYYRDLEKQKEDNLKKKEEILVQLRTIIDGEESNQSHNEIKNLQEEWKKVGNVPYVHNKTLWANYNALLDRYYDNRSIYFELKDLDRKKNARLKIELCEKAHKLAELDDISSAIAQLNDLHNEYKSIGPVPQEIQEELWNHFKVASDRVYERRNAFYDQLKVERDENLVKKTALTQKIEEFARFDSDRIKEWNEKTKDVQDIQKEWNEIGAVPRTETKTINKTFWGSFKQFFNNKNEFFKKLEASRADNLALKNDLIAKAAELKESEDWAETTQKFKDLQTQWKEIGPVPEKIRSKIYLEFKGHCDAFFDSRRAANDKDFKEQEENLKTKLEICDKLEELSQQNFDIDEIYELIDNYNELGFVPKNAIKTSRNRFEEVTNKVLSNDLLNKSARIELQNHIQIGEFKNSPGGERKLQRKEQSVRRKITSLENDINTWKTNMEFFAKSATASKLKESMLLQIEDAQKEIETLKEQLKMLSE